LAFQKEMQAIGDMARYDPVVVILANLTKFNDKQIKQLIDYSTYEIMDFNKTYEELVFPLCSGTYYDPTEISIQISLTKKEQSKLSQEIESEAGPCYITVIYVPTAEIGRVLYKYKNSMLKYNPRNYLSLSKNQV